jgi:hypothetical protein
VRTTIDLSDDAYQIAKSIARERRQSLGVVVSAMITDHTVRRDSLADDELDLSGDFPTFRCVRRVTSKDVADLEDE